MPELSLPSQLTLYLLAAASFWWVWANVMTTATSLRFCDPGRNLPLWLVTDPLGILLGAADFVWTILHFEVIDA